MSAFGTLDLDHTAAVGNLIEEPFIAFLAFLDYFDVDEFRRGWGDFTSVDTLIHRHIF